MKVGADCSVNYSPSVVVAVSPMTVATASHTLSSGVSVAAHHRQNNVGTVEDFASFFFKLSIVNVIPHFFELDVTGVSEDFCSNDFFVSKYNLTFKRPNDAIDQPNCNSLMLIVSTL